jgi:hypothetical protein
VGKLLGWIAKGVLLVALVLIGLSVGTWLHSSPKYDASEFSKPLAIAYPINHFRIAVNPVRLYIDADQGRYWYTVSSGRVDFEERDVTFPTASIDALDEITRAYGVIQDFAGKSAKSVEPSGSGLLERAAATYERFEPFLALFEHAEERALKMGMEVGAAMADQRVSAADPVTLQKALGRSHNWLPAANMMTTCQNYAAINHVSDEQPKDSTAFTAIGSAHVASRIAKCKDLIATRSHGTVKLSDLTAISSDPRSN